jgi:hypothetical protein
LDPIYIYKFLVVSFADYITQTNETLLAIADHAGILTPANRQVLEEVDEPFAKNVAEGHEKQGAVGFDDTMSVALRDELSAFYAPFNSELMVLMDQKNMRTAGPRFAF